MSSYFSLHKAQGTQALKDIFARPMSNMLTILVLAFSLALPTILFILAKNVILLTNQWQSHNQLTVYLKNVPEKRIGQLIEELNDWSKVNSVEYISPNEGLQELGRMQGFKDAVNLLENNPLPPVLIVVPRSDDAALATEIATELRKDKAVDDVRFDSEWLQRLAAIESLVHILTMAFTALMLMAVVLVIGNTLRLQLLNQKEEIQVMKLVGATDSFILRPYLYTGMWLALAGAVLAWILSVFVTWLLSAGVEKLATLYNSGFHLVGLRFDEVVILFMVSGLLGHLSARFAAGRHLKEIEPV